MSTEMPASVVVAEPAQQTNEAAQVEQVSTQTEPQAPAEVQQPQTVELTIEEKARKLENAVKYREKKLAKMEARYNQKLAELEQRLNQQTTGGTQSQPDGPPNPDNFETYADYLIARQDYNLDQKLQQRDEERQKETVSQHEQRYYEEARQRAATNVEKAAESIPDFAEVWEQNVELLDSLPKHIEQAFYEAENTAMAIYTLAKEGKLEELASMSPARAAMEIARAEARSANLSKPQVSKAPAPMNALKGNNPGRSDSVMSGKELLKKHGFKH